MLAEKTCRRCGTALSSASLEGLCPTCVGRSVFDDALLTPPVGVEPALSPEIEAAMARLKPEEEGERIGHYKLLEQIGEGGFGTVWVAEQAEPVRRRVALKIIKMGMDTRDVIARFEQERQALAMMDHPNIAKVLDAGATQWGRPFFVMELVRGIKITDYCDQQELATADRIALFIRVCHAVQHAHQKGIIHRDLKPSNILVTINDGEAVPKVIDFGVAKATQGRLSEHTVYTQFQQMIGTPLYMSPEQAEMTSLDIDTRSDIYSLGVLLYELLTGRTPIAQETLARVGLDEIRRVIREVDPPRPSMRLKTMDDGELTTAAKRRDIEPGRLQSALRGDLDWIVMKALEKNRNRRYETANGLALDLQRHLQSEPVLARPPSNLYRFQKLAQRNRLAFAAAGMVTATLVIGLAVSTWLFFREKEARERATTSEHAQAKLRLQAEAGEERAGTEARKSQRLAAFLQTMLKGVDPNSAKGRDISLLREILDRAAATVGEKLRDEPAVEAELRATIGRVYYSLGEYGKAGDQQMEALRLYRTIHGEISVPVASTLREFADTLRDRGDLAGAETNDRARLELWRQLEVPAGPNVALAINDLGLDLWSRGDLTGAKPLFRQVLDQRRKAPGVQPRELAESLTNVGLVLWESGELDEAEPLHRESLDLMRPIVGEDTLVAQLLNNLALVHRDRGDLARSEELFGESLGLLKKLVSTAHPHAVWVSANLAGVLRRRAALSGDVALLRRALHLNPTDPLTADAMACLLAKPALHPFVPDTNQAAPLWQYSYQTPAPQWNSLDFAAAWAKTAALSATSTYTPRSQRIAPRLREVWLRREIELPEVPKGKLVFHLSRNEDAQIFVNGIRAAPTADWTDAEVLVPCSAAGRAALKPGPNILAIHCLDTDGGTRIGVELRVSPDPDMGRQQLIEEYNRMIEEEPQRGELHAGRASTNARLARWERAAADLNRAIELKSSDHPVFWYQRAPVLLAQGDRPAYLKHRQEALSQFAKPNSPNIAAQVAMLSLLAPANDAELAAAVKLASIAALAEQADSGLSSRQLAKGLAEYRQRQFTSAVAWMEKTAATAMQKNLPGWNHERERNRLATAFIVSAMAHHQLRNTAAARESWDKALDILQTQCPQADSGDLGREWPDWLIAKILRSEAEPMMTGRSKKTGGDTN